MIDGVTSGAGTWARLAFDPATGSPWIVDSPTGIGAVRFWYKNGVGSWQAEQVGAGFRPALLVHDGVPIVSYVTPDGYGLTVATRGGGWVGGLAAAAGFGYIGQSSLAVPYGRRRAGRRVLRRYLRHPRVPDPLARQSSLLTRRVSHRPFLTA